MKHNLFTITALSAAMLAGFAHADDVDVPDASGSKTYTFDFTKTIDGTLSLDFIHNGSTVGDYQQYEYIMGAPGTPVQGSYIPPGRSLYSVILKDHVLSSNTADTFTFKFQNSQPMTFDDGSDVVNCLEVGTTSCGENHQVWLSGRGIQNITQGDYRVNGVRAGENLDGFHIVHFFNSHLDKFASGTYKEQWKLTITPEIN